MDNPLLLLTTGATARSACITSSQKMSEKSTDGLLHIVDVSLKEIIRFNFRTKINSFKINFNENMYPFRVPKGQNKHYFHQFVYKTSFMNVRHETI